MEAIIDSSSSTWRDLLLLVKVRSYDTFAIEKKKNLPKGCKKLLLSMKREFFLVSV